MFIEERLNKILELVQSRRRITVTEASAYLQVSLDTARRDFSRLDEMGLVLRTHGGIMSKESVSFDPGMTDKGVQHGDEKEAIAKKAAGLIMESEIVIIDAGTTTERMVKYLPENKNITVLTDALNVAVESTRRKLNTIILGGVIRNSTLCVTGPDAVEMARHYHADKLIMGLSALSTTKGLMGPNRIEAEIKKELIKAANQVIVVADHSKLQKTALYSFGTLDDIDILITDKNADPAVLKELEAHDIEVVLTD